MKSWIYFVRHGADGPIKIGRASDPRKHVMDFAIGLPVSLSLLGAILSDCAEAKIHARLNAHCIRGEWFIADEVLCETRRLGARLRSPEELTLQETPNDVLDTNVNFRARLKNWRRGRMQFGMSQWARLQLDKASVAESAQ